MNKYLKKLQGFGLVESLVALAIFGTAILAATKVTINSLRVISENEVADYANSYMLTSLEYARQPSFAAGTGGNTYFKTKFVGNTFSLEEVSGDQESIKATDCTDGSQYKIDNRLDDEDGFKNALVCSQVIVNYDTKLVKSRLVYALPYTEPVLFELKGFLYQEIN